MAYFYDCRASVHLNDISFYGCKTSPSEGRNSFYLLGSICDTHIKVFHDSYAAFILKSLN